MASAVFSGLHIGPIFFKVPPDTLLPMAFKIFCRLETWTYIIKQRTLRLAINHLVLKGKVFLNQTRADGRLEIAIHSFLKLT